MLLTPYRRLVVLTTTHTDTVFGNFSDSTPFPFLIFVGRFQWNLLCFRFNNTYEDYFKNLQVTPKLLIYACFGFCYEKLRCLTQWMVSWILSESTGRSALIPNRIPPLTDNSPVRVNLPWVLFEKISCSTRWGLAKLFGAVEDLAFITGFAFDKIDWFD